MSNKTTFSSSYLFLAQEGYLIRSCLTLGLTELRKANVGNMGAFYSALFNLSVGIERLLKVIIIVDHMLQNKLAVLSTKELKKYGHNLIDLHNSVITIANRRGIEIPSFSSLDAIDQDLLNLLSEFAKITRYHNLDSLSKTPANQNDPLARWNEILNGILEKDVPEKRRTRILNQSKFVAGCIEKKVFVLMNGLDKQPLTIEDVLALPELHDAAVKYAILRLVNLLSPFRDLIDCLCHETYSLNLSSPPIPQLQEFLEWLWNDRQYVLRKKKWS
ncbi:MAG: hypothetical protein PHC99_12325 [Methylococcales bacterium]|nr:hypothetical protein [Methylococcales bacterium]